MSLKGTQNKNSSRFNEKFYAQNGGATGNFSQTDFEAEINQIRELIELGVSRVAEEKSNSLLKLKPRDANLLANIRLNLSKALELQARYQEALDVLKMYESEEVRLGLSGRVDVEVQTQIAVIYNYLANAPKAIFLLKEVFDQATVDNADNSLIGLIKVSLSRSYRAVGQHPIARDFAFQALESYREVGDRRGMVSAYIALSTISVQENKLQECIEICGQILNIIGNRPENFTLGRVYSDMSAAYTLLHRPIEGIACLEKSAKYFEQTEHTANFLVAYNNLGLNLITVGNWERAEKTLLTALKIAVETNHKSLPVIYDSIGELYLLREKFDEAEKYLKRAIEISQIQNRKWYIVQALHTWGRYHLATKKYKRALEISKQYLEIAEQLNNSFFIRNAHLQLADVYLQQGKWKEFEVEINRANSTDEDDDTDLQISAYSEQLRGYFAKANGDLTLAEYHFNRSLSLYEVLNDYYFSALCRLELGVVIAKTNPKRAAENLDAAIENFLRLQIKSLLDKARKARSEIKDDAAEIKQAGQNIGLLTTRLAEAVSSRELLFHEFLTVLQQESKAKKILIARSDGEKKKLSTAVFSGFTPAESETVVSELQEANNNNALSDFAEAYNYAVIQLSELYAPSSFLLIFPRAGAKLADNSNLKPLIKTVELGLKVCALHEKNKTQKTMVEADRLKVESPLPGFIHSSPGMNALVDEIYKIRASDITVLITGESGTGKELVSRAVHALSNRKDKIFIPFNCTAIPKELAEGHLFGYKKGAFTGAVNDHTGVIRSADGGTLFLDEIGDLPLDVQPKLLRFLQEGEIHPLGEKKPMNVDVRVIAATNVGLEQKVAEGLFREDLYYRLNVIRLPVPPLRERRSEIPLLVNHYLNHYSAQFNKRNVTITPQTIDLLMVGNWDGNIRQLCNELQRIVVRADDGETITPEHLSPELRRNNLPLTSEHSGNTASSESSATVFSVNRESGTLDEIISQIESRIILETLQRHNGNVSRVAKELDISRRNLYMKLERYNLIKPTDRLSKFNVDS
jgi:transcriptional regulator with PAS, ATPase and Fis domain